MGALKVLFIGGSGVISSACSRLAVERGIELWVLNRGQTTARPLPAAARVVHADVRDLATTRAELGDEEFDAVVDWVAFTPDDTAGDLELFRDRTRQFVFLSSASAYQTPPARGPRLRRDDPVRAGRTGDRGVVRRGRHPPADRSAPGRCHGPSGCRRCERLTEDV